MTHRLVVLAIAAAALLGLVGWLVLGSGGSSRDRSGIEAGSLVAGVSDASRSTQAEISTPARAPSSEQVVEKAPEVALATGPAADGSKRVSVHEEELADAIWLAGQVLFPTGTPADERVTVIANGRGLEHVPEHRCEVGPDGVFRVAFTEKTRWGRLSLEARYLYLAQSVRIACGRSRGPWF